MSRTDRRPRLIPVTVGALLAFALLVALGGWQLARLQWKTELIETAQERLARPPQPWPTDTSDPAALNYVRVETVFTPRPGPIMYQPGGSPQGRAGLRVLVTADVEGAAEPVLVDIGWIPLDRRETSILLPEGPLQVQGVLRAPEEPNLLTPENDPERNTWFWLDLPAIARQLDGVPLAPVIIRAERIRTAEGVPALADYPLQGPTVLDIPNNHLQYAVTWFALALVLVVIYLLFVRSLRRDKETAQP